MIKTCKIRRLLLCICITLAATLHASAAEKTPDFSWRQNETSITLLNDERVVWQHVHDKKIGKPYMRFGLLDGTEMTRPCPMPKGYSKADHVWHRALWWSWKAINGANYWEKNQEGTEPVEVKIATNKDGSAQIDMKIAYHEPGKPVVVNEHRVIRVSKPDATGNYLIDWQTIFTPAGDDEVVFDRNSYGGFALRMAGEYCGGVVDSVQAWKFIQNDRPADAKKGTARWMAFHGTAQNGRPAAVAMFSHPGNPRYPSSWQTRNHYPYLNPSFTCNEAYTLAAGESLKLHYGVFIIDGLADPAAIERAWKTFAGAR